MLKGIRHIQKELLLIQKVIKLLQLSIELMLKDNIL